ncbi:hypothetical protein [Pseudomonas sp. L1(2025)]|uniref:hypothetical protein n=1 Tax=Pseudomonas sp. L1(2025) TaxID=3449429 RepID=UPI003F69208D
MSKIDPTRLSYVLAALAKPKERVTSSASNPASPSKNQKSGKNMETLRTRLHSRLNSLNQHAEGFRDAAPVVTVQEILCWEFGDGILEHGEFKHIAQKVTETMMGDPKVEKAMHAIVDQALSEK